MGQHFKTLFTIGPSARYVAWMFLLAASALLAADAGSPAQASRAVVQATATVRIVSGARISWDKVSKNSDLPSPRSRIVQTESGPRLAHLIEFQ